MNYYIQGSPARADEIKAAFEKLGIRTDGYDFSRKDVLFFTFEAKGKTYMMSSLLDTGLDNIILTHPDYKELELPVEPKFKVGDWLVYENGDCFTGGLREVQVQTVEKDRYIFTHNTYGSFRFIDSNCRLWSIADAKDGDIIGFNDCTHNDGSYIDLVGIYKRKRDDSLNQNQHLFHCVVASMGTFRTGGSWRVFTAYPATKEQRDLLFSKMKEAGYEWDADKKELRKIQTHYDIANFHVGMPVLVRDYNNSQWSYVQFSHLIAERNVGEGGFKFNACGIPYIQCIPFEGNEALLGTTEMCDEMYINW